MEPATGNNQGIINLNPASIFTEMSVNTGAGTDSVNVMSPPAATAGNSALTVVEGDVDGDCFYADARHFSRPDKAMWIAYGAQLITVEAAARTNCSWKMPQTRPEGREA